MTELIAARACSGNVVSQRPLSQCTRNLCKRQTEGDAGFCRPCARWLAGDTDIDPNKEKASE